MTKIIFDKINEIYNLAVVDENAHVREYIGKISKQIIDKYQLYPTDKIYENFGDIYNELRNIKYKHIVEQMITEIFHKNINLYHSIINREKDSPIFSIILDKNNENLYLNSIKGNLNMNHIIDTTPELIKRLKKDKKFNLDIDPDFETDSSLTKEEKDEIRDSKIYTNLIQQAENDFEELKLNVENRKIGDDKTIEYSPIGIHKDDDTRDMSGISNDVKSDRDIVIPQKNKRYSRRAEDLYKIYLKYKDNPIISAIYEQRLSQYHSNQGTLGAMPKLTNAIPPQLDKELSRSNYSYSTVEYFIDDIILIETSKQHIETFYNKPNHDIFVLPTFQHNWLEAVMSDKEFQDYLKQSSKLVSDKVSSMEKDSHLSQEDIENKHQTMIDGNVDPVFGLPILPPNKMIFKREEYKKIKHNSDNEQLLDILQQYIDKPLGKILKRYSGVSIPTYNKYSINNIISVIDNAESSSKIIYISLIIDFYFKTFTPDKISLDISIKKNDMDNYYDIEDESDLDDIKLKPSYSSILDDKDNESDGNKIIYEILINMIHAKTISEKKLVSKFNITKEGQPIGFFYYKTYPIKLIKQNNEIVFRIPKFFNENSLNKLINERRLEISGWYQYNLHTNIKNESDEISFERIVVNNEGDYIESDEFLFYEAIETLSNWRKILLNLHNESLQLKSDLTEKFQFDL